MNKFKKVALRVSPKTLISLSISVSEIFCVWVLKVIAGCLSEEEIQGLKEMFKAIDTDNSGSTTMEELRQGLCKQGTKLSEHEVKQLMEAVSSSETLLSSSRVLLLHWFFFIIRERGREREREREGGREGEREGGGGALPASLPPSLSRPPSLPPSLSCPPSLPPSVRSCVVWF